MSAQAPSERFVILAGKPGTNILPDLYEKGGNPQWHYLFAETAWAQYQHYSPLVFSVEPDTPLWQWAMDRLSKDAIEESQGVILESDRAFEDVLDWARSRLVLTTQSQNRLLRYWDPRVWESLEPEDRGDGTVIQQASYWTPGPDRRHMFSRNPDTGYRIS